MSILFWTGIAIFALGFIVRYLVKFKYYQDYRDHAHTELQRQQLRLKYRPRVYIGLGIEIVGCLASLASIFFQ